MNRGGFSWKRFVGLSAAKSRVSRTIGVPLTRSGRQRKLGRAMGCVVFVALLAAAIAIYGAASQKQVIPDNIRSQRFELVDANGNLRALLSISPDGLTNLNFYDQNMKIRMRLLLEKDGTPRVVLSTADGQTVSELPDNRNKKIDITMRGESAQTTPPATSSPETKPASGDQPTDGQGLVVIDCKVAGTVKVHVDPKTQQETKIGRRVAIGSVRNDSTYTYKQVRMWLNYYDKQGAQVASDVGETFNLPPKQIWKFELDLPSGVSIETVKVVRFDTK